MPRRTTASTGNNNPFGTSDLLTNGVPLDATSHAGGSWTNPQEHPSCTFDTPPPTLPETNSRKEQRKTSPHDAMSPAPQGAIGGRLLQFAHVWAETTTDRWVLQTVSYGYSLEFSKQPRERFIATPRSRNPHKHQNFAAAVSHLLTIQAIESVPNQGQGKGVYSIFFLFLKKNESTRALLDLKWLNKRVAYKCFQMETLKSISEAIIQNDWMASIEQSEAYLHIPIHREHRTFLRFCYGQSHFQYRALPFGLTSSPRVFTKVLVALVVHLRTLGVRVHPYLDDLLVRALSRLQCQKDVETILECLRKHGFVVNLDKSMLVPSQVISHLGVVIDSSNFRIWLNKERVSKIQALMQQVVASESTDLMILAKLQGMLVCCQDLVSWSRFHSRPLLQRLLLFQRQISQSKHMMIPLLPTLCQQLRWWLDSHRLTRVSLHSPVRKVVTPDASMVG
ncbi:uncharacterized protein LOC133383639 [Rhineura floridana]|uniref:uncharacterized protein LOC133383639 n=1 Tax=Rhineura floridana TaxID=261503 RepID=UPI002AC7F5E0|nr:uncharacterized protein LOC133383639 [Rhineura floridana]